MNAGYQGIHSVYETGIGYNTFIVLVKQNLPGRHK